MKKFLAVLMLMMMLCGTACAKVYMGKPPAEGWTEDVLRVTAIPVGEGDALLLECGGEAMMVDGGTAPYRENLRDAIREKGIEQFKYLLNTHFHEDHVPGLTWLMHYGFGVGEYLHPYNDFAVNISQVHADAIKEATRRGIPIRQIFDGDELMLGEAVITLIRYDGGKSTNGRSVVARIDFGSASLLLTADIIGDTQTWLSKNRSHLLDVDIIKAPHHGITPMVTAFLKAASPLAVLMTNDYDRVDKGRVQTEQYQLPAFYSGEGRVVFETDGDDWYIYQNTGKF